MDIPCPRCFGPINGAMTYCPDGSCGFRIPHGYHETCLKAPPLPIVAIGLARHGKSSLLAAMITHLQDLSEKLDGVAVGLLGETINLVHDWRLAALRGEELSQTSPRNSDANTPPEPLIFSIQGIGSPRTLLLYDVAGEDFYNQRATRLNFPALSYAQTIWFVVSAIDVQMPEDITRRREEAKLPKRIDDLVDWYDHATRVLGQSVAGRNAVIVFSKGDLLRGLRKVMGRKPLWEPIQRYLDGDPYSNRKEGDTIDDSAFDDWGRMDPFPLESYQNELDEISGRLQGFKNAVDGAASLATKLEGNRMTVRYCIAAPLGAGAHERLVQDGYWRCQRVIDPLVWTMRLEKDRVARSTLYLVLDSTGSAAGIHPGIVQDIWKRLSDRVAVKIFFLGQPDPCLPAAAPPPVNPPTVQGLSLIGPLLESLDSAARVVVVASRPILDMPDFHGTSWHDRLLLYAAEPAAAQSWHGSQTLLNHGGSLDRVANFAIHRP